MSLIKKLTEQFNSKEIREKFFDELGVPVFAHPLNMETKQKWIAMSGGNNGDYLVYAVIYGAKDKDGNCLFSIEDKVALKTQCDSDTISDIATFVLGVDSVPELVAEKN